jgi:putative membrane protein
MFRDRAVGNFAYPWFLCVAVSAVWWALYENVSHLRHPRYDLSEFDRMYALIFTALGFMLVFRLSRAAIRFWDCRTAWGTIAMRGRALCDDAIVNVGAKRPEDVDDLIRWFCAFVVGVKCHLRECGAMPAEQLAGILERGEVERINASMRSRFHLYCANKMRRAVKRALLEESNEEDSNENGRFLHPQHSATLMHGMRAHVDVLVDVAGAMERIKATRLPIVYVAHLRTFLLVYILSMPFVYVSLWGFGVVPATAIIAFALLGIEGAATECENPFSAKRTNHLGMDGFCENAIADLDAMLRWWRDESAG